ncbi:hypothetical protein [Methylorubrum salsuginis]|uniref:Uncharacterized protein n=1 Tax=Methylorubrum salsuginis TaxID=414703 RepID=A0A1I4G8G8_9HYPH|nr:hypothetical protein [Methylorubrum salsuginis]SFL25396.1 hypothetical protein SAMN04488125_111113 [Methylorubrum salsuginis]
MRMRRLVSAAGLSLLAALSCPVAAQDAAPAPEATPEAAPAPRKPKPRPKPKPKPPEKAAEKPAEEKAAAEAPASDPAVPLAPAPPAVALAAAPPVACEKGEAVRYEGNARAGKAPGAPLELWVTRSGLITIDNPLRPLTPDTTRVLQVVIGGKVATAYGPDFQSLHRGAGPAVLEGVIGGAIRWDASLIALPDTFPILSDSGDILAAFTFRACGTAPAAKTLAAPKPRRTAPTADALAPETGKDTTRDPTKTTRPPRRAEPRPDAAPRAPAVPLPQGAIP